MIDHNHSLAEFAGMGSQDACVYLALICHGFPLAQKHFEGLLCSPFLGVLFMTQTYSCSFNL